MNKSLKSNYYLRGREWPYKSVKPRIIAEQYMVDFSTSELRDYKVHCFNGVPKVILVCCDRFTESGLTEDFFDTDWNHQDFVGLNPMAGNAETEPVRPVNLTEQQYLRRRW